MIDPRAGYNMATWHFDEPQYPGEDPCPEYHKELTRRDTHYINLPEIILYRTKESIAPWDWSKLKKATAVAYFQAEHSKMSDKSNFTPRLVKLHVLKTVSPLASVKPGGSGSGSAYGSAGGAGGSGAGGSSPTKRPRFA
jgi:hypothetical protein